MDPNSSADALYVIVEGGLIALSALQSVILFAIWWMVKGMRDKVTLLKGDDGREGPPGPQGAMGYSPPPRDEPPTKTLSDKDINGWE